MRLLASLFGRMAEFEESAEVHASAAFLESLAMSHGDLANLLRMALKADYPDQNTYVWSRDVYDDSVVYEVSGNGAESLYQRSYSILDGVVTFGDAVKVIAVTQYVPVTEAGSESGREELTGDLVPLTEKAVTKDGSIRIKVIQAGQGSSGFYPVDVLKRDGPTAFTKGLHMHLDHPSASEESDRPERSVATLAGTLTSDARWDEHGAAGPGLYADAKVRSDLAPLIEELAPHIGVSIRALGKAGTRDIDGKKTRTIESIDSAKSVDFVTTAGAGGKVLDLVESARGRRTENERTDDVDKAEFEATKTALAEAQTQIAAQAAELARIREANIIRDARSIVVEALAGIALPEITRTRLAGQLAANPPVKDGALDREALVTAVTEAANEELAYLVTATGIGTVRGMGGGGPKDEDVRGDLVASFVEAGYSKDIAARMAAR